MEGFIFYETPVVEIATNKFINVPIVLQYEDTPLLEVVKSQAAGYEIQIPIYYSDGTYLAKVSGSRLHLTDEGKKAGVTLRYPQNKTICEIGGKTIFEIERTEAAALKTYAELFTPDGAFVKCSNKELLGHVLDAKGKQLKINNVTMLGNTIINTQIGILITRNGHVGIGGG